MHQISRHSSVLFQIEKALGELEAGNSYVALMLLKEMADNSPAVFNLHVKQFLSSILPILSHPDKEIRLAAVEALQVRSQFCRMCMAWECEVWERRLLA